MVINSSEKHREKHCFIILSSFSHNLTRKLIFSQKEWESSKFDLLYAFICFLMLLNVVFDAFKCCFWCFQMLFLMLLMLCYTYGLSIQSVEIERLKIVKENKQFEETKTWIYNSHWESWIAIFVLIKSHEITVTVPFRLDLVK